MLSGDICTEKTVQNMQKFSIETDQVRQHDVVAVVPKAVHGCIASEGDLRHGVAPVFIIHQIPKSIVFIFSLISSSFRSCEIRG